MQDARKAVFSTQNARPEWRLTFSFRLLILKLALDFRPGFS